MEDESVAQDVELNQEIVADRVKKLNELFDDLQDTYAPRLQQAKDLHSADTWSSIEATAEYRAAVRATFEDAESRLRGLWTKVQDLCTTLQKNAADLTNLDQATQDSLNQLIERASQDMPEPTPTPYRPMPGMMRPDVDVPVPLAPSAASPGAAPAAGDAWGGGPTP